MGRTETNGCELRERQRQRWRVQPRLPGSQTHCTSKVAKKKERAFPLVSPRKLNKSNNPVDFPGRCSDDNANGDDERRRTAAQAKDRAEAARGRHPAFTCSA